MSDSIVDTNAVAEKPIRSTIPTRLDRLKWSPFHTRMVFGLGVAWVLDGLEITIASAVTGVLIQPNTLHLTTTQVGLIATSRFAWAQSAYGIQNGLTTSKFPSDGGRPISRRVRSLRSSSAVGT